MTRSHGTKLHILVSKLPSGTSKTKEGALFWKSHLATCLPVCNFVPCDRVVQRAYYGDSYYRGYNCNGKSDHFWRQEPLSRKRILIAFAFIPQEKEALKRDFK